jgi:hypothetical protein
MKILQGGMLYDRTAMESFLRRMHAQMKESNGLMHALLK